MLSLTDEMIGEEEKEAMIACINSGQITYGERVRTFEKEFAKHVGSPYAVMVNSGSSANLLAVAAVTNPKRGTLKPGDSVVVPAVAWSTSVFPIIQMGLNPVYVDVDAKTSNLSISHLEETLGKQVIAGIVLVHVIGSCTDMDQILALCKKHQLVCIEDTCESLGSTYGGKWLGTLGDFGTYSLYFSHHITSGEGGVVTCKTQSDYELLLCLRAHGWTRHLPPSAQKNYESRYRDIDPRFLFVNTGFNVRPMDLQASVALVQLRKLDQFVANRKKSHAAFAEMVAGDSFFKEVLDLVGLPDDRCSASWFGIGMVLRRAYWHQLHEVKAWLGNHKIETRPLISGNMLRQPFNVLHSIVARDFEYGLFPGAEQVHHGGLFVGLHSQELTSEQLENLYTSLREFEWKPQRRILVTGGSGMLGRALARTHNDDNDLIKYVSSRDADLRSDVDTKLLFDSFFPTHVVHCAAVVGGLYKNMNDNMDIGLSNAKMNVNVVRESIRHGVKTFVGISSTCVFPEGKVNFSSKDLFLGPPHISNSDYAMSKRSLHLIVQKAVRANPVFGWEMLIPCNMYGPHDSFCPKNGHVIGSLIGKAAKASTTFEVRGTGRARRQFMFVNDMARIVWKRLASVKPGCNDVVCAPPEEVTIKELAEQIGCLANTKPVFSSPHDSDGQLNKFAKNEAGDDVGWTPLERGLQLTYDWFTEQQERQSVPDPLLSTFMNDQIVQWDQTYGN